MGFVGLDNMLGAVVANTLTDSIKMINISELHESEDNFFIVENIEEFAQTILGQGGVKDNLIVRPLKTGGYEIISGHRRRAAVQYLIDNGEDISHKLPCLVQEYADEEEKMLDLILMNVSARQISDSELWKCYETLDEIIKSKKEKGEHFGKIRDYIAKQLNVSSAQVGKMQNVERYAIEPVKEAIASGDLTISTANEIAKLPEEEQIELAESGLKDIKPKDVKPKKVDTNINISGEANEKEKVDTNINISEETDEAEEVDTNINFETEEQPLREKINSILDEYKEKISNISDREIAPLILALRSELNVAHIEFIRKMS